MGNSEPITEHCNEEQAQAVLQEIYRKQNGKRLHTQDLIAIAYEHGYKAGQEGK